LSNREKDAVKYQNALLDRYKSMPEISRIEKHKRLPRAITKATSKKSVMIQSLKTKEGNRRKHSKPGAVPFVPERKKPILALEK
jgi:WD repeat and SOF domain-containing protein 1